MESGLNWFYRVALRERPDADTAEQCAVGNEASLNGINPGVGWTRDLQDDVRNVAVNIRQSVVAYGHADTYPNYAGL